MKGLELAKRYYEEYGAPQLNNQFELFAPRIAVGLVGSGSECMGFDDDISHDHDFGPGFCLWLADSDYDVIGGALRAWYQTLPPSFLGFQNDRAPQAAGRVGVMRISDFYRQLIGRGGIPETEAQWLRIPEHFLSEATNGAVFRDDLGEFTRIRQGLLPCYPGDVKLKKLAARLFTMAQAGQYNYPRILKRGDMAAANLALSEFVRGALSALHLINERYAPYYKWIYRSAVDLLILPEVAPEIEKLYQVGPRERVEGIEQICICVINWLQEAGLSSSRADFLIPHAEEVMERIQSGFLSKLDVMVG